MVEESEFLGRLATPVKRFRYPILGFWAVFLIFTAIFAARFLSVTTLAFSPPNGSPAAQANEEVGEHFNNLARSTQVSLFVQSLRPGVGVVNATGFRDFSVALEGVLRDYPEDPNMLLNYMSYYTLKERNLPAQAYEGLVSASGEATIITVTIRTYMTDQASVDYCDWARDRVNERNPDPEGLQMDWSGVPAFVSDIVHAAEMDLAKMDGIVLPLAMLVLAYVLKDYHLMVLPVLIIGTSMAGAFGVMYFVGRGSEVYATTPSLMMSILIAMSIDYSLFLLTRLKEELVRGHTMDDAVKRMLSTAGYTITVSGLTLAVCFIGLVFFPLTILSSLGIGCAFSLLLALLVSLTLVPAMLFTFPNWFSKCTRHCLHNCRGGEEDQQRLSSPWKPGNLPSAPPTDEELEDMHGVWRKIAEVTTQFPYNLIIILVVCGAIVPFVFYSFGFALTDAFASGMPRGSTMLDVYSRMGEEFGYGTMKPYQLLMVPPAGVSAFSEEFFTSASGVLTAVATNESIPDTHPGNFQSPMYAGGMNVTWPIVQLCTNVTSPIYNIPECIGIRFSFEQYINPAQTAALAHVILSWDPAEKDGRLWLERMRGALEYWHGVTGINFYVAGIGADSGDTVEEIYRLFPLMIAIIGGIVLILVGFVFRSVVVPIRALLSIALTLAFVYGFAVLTYEKGSMNWMTWSAMSSEFDALQWLIPIICFPIIVGIALDYDIFLLLRIREYYMSGVGTREAVIKGVCMTGHIITAAGIIMAIAFSGLMFSSMPALNQLSFFLVFAVLLDTFVIRTLLVPSLMGALGDFNWWPRPRSDYVDLDHPKRPPV